MEAILTFLLDVLKFGVIVVVVVEGFGYILDRFFAK